MVLYDGANNFYGRYSKIETGGGGFTCEFLQMLKKYHVDLIVPNFNVTDCRYFAAVIYSVINFVSFWSFRFGRFVLVVSLISLVSLVLFRCFRFDVSVFSTCPLLD